MSTSTASPTSSIRACSTAGCRRSPTPARCGSPAGSARWRAWSATRRKSTTSASRSTTRCAASRTCTSPITARCGGCSRRVHREFGAAILIDCHSMPSTTGAEGRAAARRRGAGRPLRHELRRRRCRRRSRRTLRELGYAVSRNKPYAGGFITEHYGNPAAGLHAIQLEINRGALHGRAALRALRRLRPAGRATSRRWPTAWPRSRSRSCGPTAPPPNSASAAKKKGRRQCQRPKSREETPKEGGGKAIRRTAYRAAQICSPRRTKSKGY